MSAVPGTGALKKYSGSILLGFGVLALVGALVFLFNELKDLSDGVVGASLPLLAIGGVILLVLLLTAVAMIFSILGLANKDQAMGLPEGSIRAVIALSLIVLFAILSVFLYKSVNSGGRINTIVNLSDTERTKFIRDHANARDIGSAISKDSDGQPIVVKDKNGHPVKNDDGTPRYLYDVSYSSTNAASDDFAKQLLVLLGTLMTAITSFYLGAGTATSAAAATQTAISAISPPTVSGIDPKSQSISKDGTTIHLKVAGSNLNIITHVTIASAGVQIVGTNVASNPTQVTCDLNVANATPGVWDVVVDDGGSKSATLPGALTISA